jgi:hypothetical protein
MAREQAAVLTRPIHVAFAPQRDITAFELAQIMPHFRYGVGGDPILITLMPTQWTGLDPSIRRHFKQT